MHCCQMTNKMKSMGKVLAVEWWLTDLTGYRVGSSDPHARIPLQCQGVHSIVCLQHFSAEIRKRNQLGMHGMAT